MCQSVCLPVRLSIAVVSFVSRQRCHRFGRHKTAKIHSIGGLSQCTLKSRQAKWVPQAKKSQQRPAMVPKNTKQDKPSQSTRNIQLVIDTQITPSSRRHCHPLTRCGGSHASILLPLVALRFAHRKRIERSIGLNKYSDKSAFKPQRSFTDSILGAIFV